MGNYEAERELRVPQVSVGEGINADITLRLEYKSMGEDSREYVITMQIGDKKVALGDSVTCNGEDQSRFASIKSRYDSIERMLFDRGSSPVRISVSDLSTSDLIEDDVRPFE